MFLLESLMLMSVPPSSVLETRQLGLSAVEFVSFSQLTQERLRALNRRLM